MIKTIDSGIVVPPMPYAEQILTPEQQSLISDTLSTFDADNLSEADALSIVDTLSQAGIKPNAALGKKMSNLGFDAKQIGELANTSEPKKSPPPRQSTEEITSIVDYLTQLLEEKLVANNNSSLSEEDKQAILTKVFEKYELEESRSSMNTTA